MRPQPLIAVTDVEASSRWYQRLLGCQSAHGGPEYERLTYNGALVMQLHRFDVEHHHGAIGNPEDRPYGNGVLLWFEIDDFDAALARAAELKAEIVMSRHRNPPDGDGGPNHWECWLRDPDGYLVVLVAVQSVKPALRRLAFSDKAAAWMPLSNSDKLSATAAST
jgi:catechol 2,3-dioxygenase-like lactoylglutathione lyase family enzyme